VIAPHSGQPRARRTAARPQPAPPSGLRLTRRGRLVLSVFALALILGLITILWATLANGAQAASEGTRTGSVYQGLHRVTVLPGQTLWTIAHHAEPSADPRTVIPEIMQINAISSTNLQPGQQLWVPRS
jgi:LysM domain